MISLDDHYILQTAANILAREQGVASERPLYQIKILETAVDLIHTITHWDIDQRLSSLSASTRPDCPVCKHSTLTGNLIKFNDGADGYLTHCQNPMCGVMVFLNKDWQVYYADQRYDAMGRPMRGAIQPVKV